MEEIGKIIHRTRKEKSMTLKQLAEETGLSVSFLSEVERGEANLSIAALARVAGALKLETIGLAGSGQSPSGAGLSTERRRANQRNRRDPGEKGPAPADPASGIRRRSELLAADLGRRMDAMYVKLKPGFEAGPDPLAVTRGEKLLYMLEGAAVMTVCGVSYALTKGDTIYYPASAPIHFQNTQDTDAEVLVILVSR